MRKKMFTLFLALLCAVACIAALSGCKKSASSSQDTKPQIDPTHKHAYAQEVIAPQCAAEGYTRFRCSCGSEYTQDETPALGHDMQDDTCVRCSALPTQGLEYTAVEGGYEVKGTGSATTADIIVPSTSGGRTVVSVGERAFDNSGIRYVTLPSTVKDIQKQGFSGCVDLRSVQMPGVRRLGDMAFGGCAQLAPVVLPDTLESIGAHVFASAWRQTAIHIPASVTSIANGAFAGCSAIGALTVDEANAVYYAVDNCVIDKATDVLVLGCKNSRIPTDGSVVEIADHAFSSVEGMTELVIPDCITKIGIGVFRNSDVQSIRIGKGLTDFAPDTFLGCEALTSIWVDAQNPKYIAAGNCLIDRAAKSVVLGCKTSVIPTDGEVVNSIAMRAFAQCPVPEDFVIPANVTAIGEYAFSGSKLKSVTVRANLTDGSRAFSGADSLQNVVIEEGVTEIAPWMFAGARIQEIRFPSSLTEIGENAFLGCKCLTELKLPSGVTTIAQSAFGGCSSLTELTIPDHVTTIGKDAFRDCYGLVKLTLGRGLTTIGSGAFYTSYKLTELVNLSSLAIAKTTDKSGELFGRLGYVLQTKTDGNNELFFEGDLYTSTDYESKLDFTADGLVFYNNNGSYELYGCHRTGAVTLPQSYKDLPYDIASGAFWYANVSELTVTGGVNKVKQLAFHRSGLQKIDFTGVRTIASYAFMTCNGLQSVTISDCESLEGYAFIVCKGLKEITLRNVRQIGQCPILAMSNNTTAYSGLERLVLDIETVTSYIFCTYTDIPAVILSSNVKTVEQYAFYNCTFDTVYYLGTVEQWKGIDVTLADEGYESYDPLCTIEICYYSESAPTGEGSYWHYGADGVTPVKW